MGNLDHNILKQLTKEELTDYLHKQITNFFPIYQNDEDKEIIYQNISPTFKRLTFCFKSIANKYYNNIDLPMFNPIHSSQNTIFLYYLANTIWENTKNSVLSTKIYYLNKVLNSVEIYYEVKLPDIFFCEHPLGSVLGRAQYSNYFTFYQGCTIGGNKGKYPVLGEYITMYSNSSILGNCLIGNHIICSAGTQIIDTDIPSFSIVFGKSPKLTVITKDESYMKNKINHLWKRKFK